MMKVHKRREARSLVIQALYQWHVSGNLPETVLKRILNEENLKDVDIKYFENCYQGIVSDTDILDKKMLPYLDRPIKRLTPIELCILHLAIYEFLNCLDVPYRVVINEALELTKIFGTEEGFKYVNGVLDKVARDLRPEEIK